MSPETYAPATFDRDVLTLSGEPLAPLKFSLGGVDAGGRAMTDIQPESFDLDAGVAAG